MKNIADTTRKLQGSLRALASEAADVARTIDSQSDAGQVLAYLHAIQDAASLGAECHDASPNRDDYTLKLAGAVLLVCREAINSAKTGDLSGLYLAEQKML